MRRFRFVSQAREGLLAKNFEQVFSGTDNARNIIVELITSTTPTQPAQVWLGDGAGRRLAWIEENRLDAAHPYAPYLASHVQPQFGTLTAADGQAMDWRLLKPAGPGPFPVLMQVYGGPHAHNVTRKFTAPIEQYLVSKGWAVFQLDNRGSNNRGMAFDKEQSVVCGERHVVQARVEQIAAGPGAVLLCGRYEGIDQRVLDRHVTLELSLGDFVLSGGELPAIALLDAVARLQDGVLHAPSHQQDSFSDGLLEGPQYSRPERWATADGELPVPGVLLSGHHGDIAAWRRQQSLALTARRRPDLIAAARAAGRLSKADEQYLASLGL